MMTITTLAVTYISPWKIAFMAAMFCLWCLAVQWTDRDAEKVKTIRERWNMICLAGGVAGLFAWMMIPWLKWPMFLIGWALFMIMSAGGLYLYVAHRNKRVGEQYRVMTPQHFSRLLSRDSRDKLDRSQHEYRVRIFDHHNKAVSLPDDFEEAAQFSAAQEILYDALWRRASEIELAATAENSQLRYRIDGVRADRREFITTQQAARAITFLKRVAGLNPDERRRPQRGAMRAAHLGGTGDPARIDVHTSGSTAGERMILKILESGSVRPLAELGIHAQRLEAMKQLVNEPSGLVICSGPPESGVTTTLYAMVKSHDAYIQNIHSLEKRRLVEVDNITQHMHNAASREVSYARQLQTVLRREPDVIMVGEMDDKETAQIVVKACLDGKKIYAGMTAKDTFDALDMLLAFTGDARAAAKVLRGITSQRLLRKLCLVCREAYRPDAKLLRKANLPVDKIEHFYRPPTQQVYDKQGREIVCPTCQGTGYVGRIGVFEVLVVDDTLRTMIKSGSNSTQIKAQARKNKMYYLQEEGLLKTMEGVTSMNEVIRALHDDAARR